MYTTKLKNSPYIIRRGATGQIDRRATIIAILANNPGLCGSDIANYMYDKIITPKSWNDTYDVLGDMVSQNILQKSGRYYYLTNDAISHDMAITRKAAEQLDRMGIDIDSAAFLAGGLIMAAENAQAESRDDVYEPSEDTESFEFLSNQNENDTDSTEEFSPASNSNHYRLLNEWFDNNYTSEKSFALDFQPDGREVINIYDKTGQIDCILIEDIADEVMPVAEEDEAFNEEAMLNSESSEQLDELEQDFADEYKALADEKEMESCSRVNALLIEKQECDRDVASFYKNMKTDDNTSGTKPVKEDDLSDTSESHGEPVKKWLSVSSLYDVIGRHAILTLENEYKHKLMVKILNFTEPNIDSPSGILNKPFATITIMVLENFIDKDLVAYNPGQILKFNMLSSKFSIRLQ